MEILSFTILGLMFITMLAILYFSKKRLNNYENRIYSKIVVSNLIGQILHILCFIVIWNHDRIPSSLFYAVTKGYLLYLITWGVLNLSYIFIVSFFNEDDKHNEKMKKIEKIGFILLMTIMTIIIIVLPIYYNDLNNKIYTYGPSVDAVYIFSVLLVIACI